MSKRSERQLPLLLMAVNALVIACGGEGGGTQPPPGDVLTVSKTAAGSGDAQTGTVGQPLASPIQVLVTENGSAASGLTVTWSAVPSTAGTMTPPSGPTNADGVASSTWLLGTVSGAHAARATVTGASGSPVTFSATAAPDAATTLASVGGGGQTGEINTQLAAPLQANVADQFGNGVPAVGVGWAATGGTVSAGTVATNAAGVSEVRVTLGGTAGPITITATSGDLTGSPLTFNATATPPPPPGQTIQVLTAGGTRFQPANLTITAPSTVTWNWPAGSLDHNVVPDDGSTPTSSGALADGPHTYSFTFNTPGTYRYYCANHGGPGGVGMSGTITVQ